MEATSVPGRRGVALPRSRRLLAALDDERLVEQLRRGNDAAFEVLFDRHHRGVLALCRHMLRSREEAEDAVQHAFAAAYTDLLAHDRSMRVRPWLYAIARNRCLSVLRARREEPAELDPGAGLDGLADAVHQRAELRHLLEDLGDLPEEQRSALVLAEVGGLPHVEIAETLGCDVKKVKSLVYQARSGLIERRAARETPCAEIREQLATLRGGSLRRGPLRRHVRACPGCRAYRDEVRRQRQMLAIALPIVPSVGLKESALASAGLSAGGGGGAAAGLAGGAAGANAGALGGAKVAGGLAAAVAKAGAAKLAVAVLATGAAVGGGAGLAAREGDDAPRRQAPAEVQPGAPLPAGAGTPAVGEGDELRERDAERGRRRAERRRARAEAAERRRGRPADPGADGRANALERGRGRKRGLREDRGARGRERARPQGAAPRGPARERRMPATPRRQPAPPARRQQGGAAPQGGGRGGRGEPSAPIPRAPALPDVTESPGTGAGRIPGHR